MVRHCAVDHNQASRGNFSLSLPRYFLGTNHSTKPQLPQTRMWNFGLERKPIGSRFGPYPPLAPTSCENSSLLPQFLHDLSSDFIMMRDYAERLASLARRQKASECKLSVIAASSAGRGWPPHDLRWRFLMTQPPPVPHDGSELKVLRKPQRLLSFSPRRDFAPHQSGWQKHPDGTPLSSSDTQLEFPLLRLMGKGQEPDKGRDLLPMPQRAGVLRDVRAPGRPQEHAADDRAGRGPA
jgi:hypothetical protein